MRRTLPFLLLLAIGCAAVVTTTDDSAKPEIVEPAPAWDAQAASEFQKAGLPVPKTVMTVETQAPLDLAWIRRAFGFVKPLSDDEKQEVERSGGGDEDAERELNGGGGAAGAELGEDEAMAPMEAPMDEEANKEGESETRAADAVGAASGFAAPPAESEESDDFARMVPEKKAKSKNGGDGDGSADVPKPLLTRIESAPRVGKILFQNAEGKFESLTPRALRLVTFVEGARARTVVDLVFSNPHDRRLQGTFFYPLPDGASPAAFGMFPGTLRVDDEAVYRTKPLLPPLPADVKPADLASVAPQSDAEALVPDWEPIQVARVVEQKRARQVYEEIVRSQIDPALLEWSGANTFKARVFPIEGKSLKRVVLTYDQTLPILDDFLRYGYPFPGDPAVGEIQALVHVRSDLGALVPGGNDATTLRKPWGEAVQTGPWTRHRFIADKGYKGSLDLTIQPAGGLDQVVSSPVAGLAGEVFYARVRPPVPDTERAQPTRRAVFCVDTSLSEEGVRRNLSGQLLLEILTADATIDEYSVLLFDVRPRWLHQVGWRKNSAEARQETADELTKVYLEGATNFAAVLDELDAQSKWLDEGGSAARFLLSDGLVTWGLDKVEALLNGHAKALSGPFYTYRFGEVATNRDLFDALSRETSGRTVTVLAANQLKTAAVAHRKAPVVLKEVRVAGGEVIDLVTAGDPRLLFPGQELEVAGRVTAHDKAPRLELVLGVEGQEQVVPYAIPDGDELVLAPRAWAELWVKSLLALDDERLDRMVVALSQAFGLANKAASLLILESEADWKAFDLKAEQVDMTDLAKLRAAEEDQRRDRLQGIGLDEVAREGRDLVRMLREHAAAPTQPALPLLDRPLAGGAERIAAEKTYRSSRNEDALNVEAYDAVARARALAGDTFGAIRALSCLVEKRPRDAEANRLVGYACLSLGQYGPAAELFERVRLNRPFEPQTYLEEALALEALGSWGEAARNYEILLAREFPRHASECKVVAAYHYARMLSGRVREGDLAAGARAQVEARLKQLQETLGHGLDETAYQLTIHWNTDSTDIDLWVVEPEGERCYYSHPETAAGGKLYWDTTTGYGPELYRRSQSGSGVYDVLIHFYGNNSPRWTVPTAVLLVRDRDVFGAEDGYTRRFQTRLLPKAQAVLRLRKETF